MLFILFLNIKENIHWFLTVVDHLNKYEVDLLSRKMKVNLDREFLERIGELNQLKVKIKS